MNDLLKQNLVHLSVVDPGLAARVESSRPPAGAEVMPSRSGPPTLVLKGISFHSRMDPRTEASRLADSGFNRPEVKNLVVFGLGLGYHVLVLAEKFTRIQVIEPDPGMIRLAFSHLDFRPVLDRVRFVVDRESSLSRPAAFWPHGPTARVHPDEFDYWTGRLEIEPRERGRPARETAGRLLRECRDITGLDEILASFDPRDEVSIEELARAVRKQTGPLSRGGIIGLLLGELAG